jgi:glycosyltransferase involved in cell wall biosynthesis
MKKILWFSNLVFSETTIKSSGTWLNAMGWALASREDVQLINISQARVQTVSRVDCGKILQWVVPYEKLRRNGLPSKLTMKGIADVVSVVQPDLIHVWGTENYWGLLTARKLLTQPALLDMQGIKYAIAPKMMGDLTFSEILKCISVKEFLRPSSFFFCSQANFEKGRRFEEEIIQGHRFVAVQSNWVRAHVEAVSQASQIFPTRILLRHEFMEAPPWQVKQKSDSPVIFTPSGCSIPYKGLHVLLRALAILKKTYSCIRLVVGGALPQAGIRRSGYERWLLREVNRLNLSENVFFLGSLSAQEIIHQFNLASVAVIPSFIESYSLSLAEAMVAGVPVVVSYAGAMPELAEEDKSALFFPSGDAVMCACRIKELLESPNLSMRLSVNARQVGRLRHNPSDVVKRQLEIYDAILDPTPCCL